MKITDIKLKKIVLTMNEPFKVAFTTVTKTTNILVKIETDIGFFGLGEAAPFVYVTGETADGCMETLRLFSKALCGMNPLEIEKIHDVMDMTVHGNESAKCAIDIALYDLKGKIFNEPVYRLLGGFQNKVQNDITIGIDTSENMTKKAIHYVNNMGYRILKIKAGLNPEHDLQTIKMIRKELGQEIRLRIDANQGYDYAKACWILEQLKPYHIEAIEQCFPDRDIENARRLHQQSTGIQLMLDESLHTIYDAARICKEDAADILNIKLMKCGGLYRGKQISAIAQSFGLKCMVGCMVETRIAITAGLSLVAALKNVTEADCDSFLYYDESKIPIFGGFIQQQDIFQLLDKPGLGIESNIDF